MEKIAVIGMAVRVPQADSIHAFWDIVTSGRCAISFFNKSQLLGANETHERINNPFYVPARGIVDDPDRFDADFFNISMREAIIMDPQHRIFLEMAWHAFESAGYNPKKYTGLISAYASKSPSQYMERYLKTEQFYTESMQNVEMAIGNEMDSFATTLAYRLNLKGSAVSVQTYCSSSLVAVHLACQALLNYECEMALAGGVNLELPQQRGYLYDPGSFCSKNGVCYAFDARACGVPFGNGAGVVVLKRYDEAIKDRDNIIASIIATAVGNDGFTKSSYTVPCVAGQEQVITEAINYAGVDAETIRYVEAHGTGTKLGDLIEIEALTNAYRRSTEKTSFCYLGSIKPNIGHLDRASGVINLIKAMLVIKEGYIPPLANFEIPNSQINFPRTPFILPSALTKWKTSKELRRAGVSAFGIGGTNAHTIIEQVISIKRKRRYFNSQDLKSFIFPISAACEKALTISIVELQTFLEQQKQNLILEDVAYTYQISRAFHDFRTFISVTARNNTIINFHQAEGCCDIKKCNGAKIGIIVSKLNWDYFDTNFIINISQLKLFSLQFEQALKVLFTISANSENVVNTEQQIKKILSSANGCLLLKFTFLYSLCRTFIIIGVNPLFLYGVGYAELAMLCLADVIDFNAAIQLLLIHARRAPIVELNSMLNNICVNPCSSKLISQILGMEFSIGDIPDRAYFIQLASYLKNENHREELRNNSFVIDICEQITTSNAHSTLTKYKCIDMPVGENNKFCFDFLSLLGKLWQNGTPIIWEKLYGAELPDKILIPPYPFQRKRYWITTNQSGLSSKPLGLDRLPKEKWFATPIFIPKPINHNKDLSISKGNKILLLAGKQKSFNSALTQILHENLINIESAKIKKESTGGLDIISSFSSEMRKLFCVVVYLPDVNIKGEIELVQYCIKVLQVLSVQKITKKIIFISSQIVLTKNVNLMQQVNSTFYIISALLKSAHLELPDVRLSLLHFLNTPAELQVDILMQEIWHSSELTCECTVHYHAQRYISEACQITRQNYVYKSSRLKNDGIYLIVGGLGGIGQAFACWLAGAFPNSQIIIATRHIHDPNPNLLNNKNIHIVKADCTKISSMRALRSRLYGTFDRECNGIFFLSAHIEDNLLQYKTRKQIKLVCLPKIRGTKNIIETFPTKDMDFVMLFSSLASVVGNIGQTDYTAANAFMNHVAQTHEKVITVNWDIWREVGFAAQMIKSTKKDTGIVLRNLILTGLTTKEGIDIIENILGCPYPKQIYVSTKKIEDLHGYLQKQCHRFIKKHQANAKKYDIVDDKCKSNFLDTEEFTVIYDALEEIWKEILNIEIFNFDTNFFDYGGNSLTAIRMLARIRDIFSIALPIQIIFQANTPQKLAYKIAEKIIEDTGMQTSTTTHDLTTKLPNGMEIFHLNSFETDHFYKDIFIDKVYDSGRLDKNKDICTFDVGANIGMFSLYMLTNYPKSQVFAFEPSMREYKVLNKNLQKFADRVRCFQIGLLDGGGQKTLTYVRNNSGMSSFYGVGEYEKDILRKIIKNQDKSDSQAELKSIKNNFDLFAKERLSSQKFLCEVKTLSQVIEENSIESIDLIKIDVQKSELDVLRGIKEKDWYKIKKIVIEVHDFDSRVNVVKEMLQAFNFNVEISQEKLYFNTDIYILYGVKI